MSIPPRPSRFAADAAPDWCELKLSAYKTATGADWWRTRPIITPRLQLVHTNGASREGSIESAINWGNANPGSNTHPHYQVDRNRAAKLVPSDRKGIGNATTTAAQGQWGNVSDWSLVIETADEGYPTPGEAAGFIGNQSEMIAQILAYESVLHAIPLYAPITWHGSGTAAHTDPWGYPYWTIANGKVCPGATKKRQLRDVILPRAREIADAWTETPEDPVVVTYFKTAGDALTIWATSDGLNAVRLEQFVCDARGINPATVQPIPAAEAAKFVYHNGLISLSVR